MKKHFLYSAGFGLLLTCFVSRAAFAQHSGHAPMLSVVVDGKVNPDQITNELAFHHFVLAASERAAAPPDELRRQQAFLFSIGLSPIDRVSLLAVVQPLRNRLDAYTLETERISLDNTLSSTAKDAAIGEIRQHTRGLISSAESQIKLSVTPDGWNYIQQFVATRVKPKIVIYSSPFSNAAALK